MGAYPLAANSRWAMECHVYYNPPDNLDPQCHQQPDKPVRATPSTRAKISLRNWIYIFHSVFLAAPNIFTDMTWISPLSA